MVNSPEQHRAESASSTPHQRRFFLWGVPRSVSSVMERAFQQRKDTTVISEPLIDLYYCSDERCSDRFLPEDPGSMRFSYRSIITRLLGEKDTPYVFSKNMAYYLNRRDPTEIVREATNSFIIRDPEKALRSHYKIDPEFTAEEAGYLALKRMFDRVVNELRQAPIVINGSDLRKEPQGTMQAYCDALGIPFDTAMLSWEAESAFDPRYRMWTGNIDNSTGVLPESTDTGDIPDRVKRMIDESRPIYKFFLQFVITPKLTSPPANSQDISSALP